MGTLFPSQDVEGGRIYYRTMSYRTIIYDSSAGEVYTRGMRRSKNFLAWCEEIFGGPHSKEWDEEFSSTAAVTISSSSPKFGSILVASLHELEEEYHEPTVEELEELMISNKSD